jgi:hypothetical protein
MPIVLVFVLALLGIGCLERPTKVTLEGENPPTFKLTGSGNLITLTIGIQSQDKSLTPSERVTKLWQLVPIQRDGKSVEDVDGITYGIVPDGYKQTFPREGVPAPLKEGSHYRYYVETINAPHASGMFELKNGHAVRVYGLTCSGIENGKDVEYPCDEN